MLLRAIIIAALCIATSVAEWSVCEHTNSIKKGSCNSASGPCEPDSGCTNAGKVDSLEACESKCEAAPNCSLESPLAVVRRTLATIEKSKNKQRAVNEISTNTNEA